MLSVEQVAKRNEDVFNWYIKAMDKVHDMDDESVEYLIENIMYVKRKNSKSLAIEKANEISRYLDVPELSSYIEENKWDGYFGLDYVFDRTIYKLLSHIK